VNPPAEFWLDVKRRYNKSDGLGKRRMELWYLWRFMLNSSLRNLPAFVKRNLTYKNSRGMALYNDVRDWLGGWPMEFAKRNDVKQWTDKSNLKMLIMKTGEANTEYLFKKKN
jgi:hypothetical protein